MNGTLYIVATPIGNLGDITARALETLKSVDLILAEDTRNTGKLLMHFGIKTSVQSYHQHSTEKDVANILSLLAEGKDLALVTDAGTPGISDPGNKLIDDLRLKIADLPVVPIPGVSAVTTALSISGFPTDKFLFLGFPPAKNKRQKYFEELAGYPFTVVFYESCHRIKKALDSLSKVLPADRQVCVCRELTKQFETVYRGTISEILAMDMTEKGEFVIVVEKD